MTTTEPEVVRAPRRRAQHKILIGSTPRAAATKKIPSALRTRACTRSLKALAAAMGINPEQAELICDAIRADAAAHGGTVRTKRVLKAAEAKGLDINGAAVKILAQALGFELEVGPEQGTGGRLGAKDLNPRKRRGPDPARPSRGDQVRRLRAEHPEWTLEQIGAAVGGMSKAGVSKHLNQPR